MRLGLFIPSVSPIATPEYLGAFAEAAEAGGFASIWMGEHVVNFDDYESRYPYSDDGRIGLPPETGMLDLFSTLAFLAAETERVRIGSAICLLPQRNPVTTAKEITTVDWLSGGRLDLGLGIGWLREEFEALHAEFDERVGRTREYVEIMRALWRDDVASYRGKYYDLPRCRMNPKPVQTPHPPIYFGGETDPALRRVAEMGDGWHGFNHLPDTAATHVQRLEGFLRERDRSLDDVDVTVCAYLQPVEPAHLPHFRDAGVDQLVLCPFAADAGGIREAIGALSDAYAAARDESLGGAMGWLIFENANLLDGEHAARAGTTVVVDGNRIASVGDGDGTTGPDDRVVDLGGRTLMPGMFTCHFHSTYDELGAKPTPFGLEAPPAYQALVAARNLATALSSGFTGVVSAGAPHDIDASLKRAIDDGVIAGPRFIPGSRDVSTTGHANDSAPWYWELKAWGAIRRVDGPDEIRKAVRDEIKRGAEIIKLFVTGGHGVMAPREQMELTRDELTAAIETAHERGALIRGHIANKRALLMAVEAGIDVVDHGDELDAECIAALAETGTFLVPSVFFPKTLAEQMGPGLGFTDAMRADVAHMCKMLPEADAAGVWILLGDDYGAMGFPHGRYGAELGVYVEDAGIAPVDVIRWATKHGAELMDMGDNLGTIEEGKLADLLVVNGDPSEDVSLLAEPANLVAIVKDGALIKDELTA